MTASLTIWCDISKLVREGQKTNEKRFSSIGYDSFEKKPKKYLKILYFGKAAYIPPPDKNHLAVWERGGSYVSSDFITQEAVAVSVGWLEKYVTAIFSTVDLKWSIQTGVWGTSKYEWHRPSRWVTKLVRGDLRSR